MIVGLIGCGKAKLGHAAEACELYTGPLFQKSRAYVEQFCDEWGILSAKYGLIMPGQIIPPYNVTLTKMARAKRMRWCETTFQAIVERWSAEESYVVLAGESYLCATAGLDAVYPLAGLGIGERLRWLNKALS